MKLDGVVGGQAAVLVVELRQKVGHAVVLPWPHQNKNAQGQAPRHLQKAKAMPPALSIQHTEDIAFIEDFTSTIPVSVTKLARPVARRQLDKKPPQVAGAVYQIR